MTFICMPFILIYSCITHLYPNSEHGVDSPFDNMYIGISIVSSLIYFHWRRSGVKTTSASSGIREDSRGLFFKAPNICTDFWGGAKNQPVPWLGGTGLAPLFIFIPDSALCLCVFTIFDKSIVC